MECVFLCIDHLWSARVSTQDPRGIYPLTVSYVAGGNPQGGPNQSMGAPYSQIQMSQGSTAYPGGNTIPQNQIPHGNPHYNAIPQGNYYTT